MPLPVLQYAAGNSYSILLNKYRIVTLFAETLSIVHAIFLPLLYLQLFSI
nr:MAG TPA: hypothetical protein [Caudoviricetes sp.]